MEISRQGAQYGSNQFNWGECGSRKHGISALELLPVRRGGDALVLLWLFCHTDSS